MKPAFALALGLLWPANLMDGDTFQIQLADEMRKMHFCECRQLMFNERQFEGFIRDAKFSYQMQIWCEHRFED